MVDNEKWILSLDIGTTVLKVGLFSISGDLIQIETREQPLERPTSRRAEQSPYKTWGYIKEAVRAIFAEFPAQSVSAISLSLQRGTVVPLDKKGDPLMDQMVWMDRRGLPYTEWLEDVIGNKEYYQESGHSISHITGISKCLWLQRKAKSLWPKVSVVSTPQTLFLRWLGCKDFVCDLSMGTYLFPMDIDKKCWSQKLTEEIGFPLEMLPKLVSATDIVGVLSNSAAEELGLQPGIPLVAGGGDGQCAAAGCGVLSRGLCMVNIGTAAGVQVFLSQPIRDPDSILNCAGHVDPSAWEMEGHTQASGSVLRWFRDEFGDIEQQSSARTGENVFDLLVAQAKDVPPGSDGLIFLPTFMGSTAPRPNPNATGVLAGLTLTHQRGYVIRALLEGVSLEIRWMLEAIEDIGVPIEEVRLAGGGSKNMIWNQIHSDVIGKPVQVVQVEDAALVGAAMCAAVALKCYESLSEAATKFVKVREILEPNKENVGVYNDVFGNYKNLVLSLEQQQVL
jgi:xylulokinase